AGGGGHPRDPPKGRARLPIAAALLLAALSARAEAREIRVKPGQNLRGIVAAARAGDTVNVAAGTYVAALIIPSRVTLVSKDGPGKARIDGGGRGEPSPIYNRHDIVIDGFEIFHSGENIVKIEGSRNITLRRCKIHDAGEDCVKATIGSQFITVEECEIYNPGRHADDGRYEQN